MTSRRTPRPLVTLLPLMASLLLACGDEDPAGPSGSNSSPNNAASNNATGNNTPANNAAPNNATPNNSSNNSAPNNSSNNAAPNNSAPNNSSTNNNTNNSTNNNTNNPANNNTNGNNTNGNNTTGNNNTNNNTNNPDPCEAGDEVALADLGPSGGSLSVGGMTLEVPAGALAAPTRVRLTRLSCADPTHYAALSPVFRVEPSGEAWVGAATARVGFVGDGARAGLVVAPTLEDSPEVAGGSAAGAEWVGPVTSGGVLYVADVGVARYPAAGAAWGQWVREDDPAQACPRDGSAPCLHGGETRALRAPDHITTCEGLSVRDALGAFNWRCESVGGAPLFVSEGLAPGVLLSELLDLDALAWRPNALVLTLGGPRGPEVYRSPERAWWDNPILDAGAAGSVGQPGQILLVGPGGAGGAWSFAADQVALVFRPEVTAAGSVSISGRAFTWLERPRAAASSGSVQWLNAAWSTGRGVATGEVASGDGVVLDRSPGARLIQAEIGRAQGTSLRLERANDATLEDVTVTPGASWALRVIQTQRATLRGLDVTTSGLSQAQIVESADLRVEGLLLRNALATPRTGLQLANTQRVHLSDVRLEGLTLDISADSSAITLEDVEAVGGGLKIQGSFNRVLRARLANTQGIAVQIAASDLQRPAQGNVLRDLRITNAAQALVFGNAAHNNLVSGALIQGGAQGITLGGSAAGANNNLLRGVTVANQILAAVKITRGDGNRLEHLALINSGMGVAWESAGAPSNTHLRDLAVSHSARYGVEIPGGVGAITFAGGLAFGANALGSCATPDGLGCASPLFNGAQLRESASLRTSFVGEVLTDDAVNPSDDNGRARVEAITEWLRFEDELRGWGLAGNGAAFPDLSQAGLCAAGNSCRIFDMNLRSTDDIALNATPDPHAGDVAREHTLWTSAPPANDAACAALFPAARLLQGRCTLRYLPDAAELEGDGDGLCASQERCLRWRNLGVYQGHGDLLDDATTAGPLITGARLTRHAQNGR